MASSVFYGPEKSGEGVSVLWYSRAGRNLDPTQLVVVMEREVGCIGPGTDETKRKGGT